MTQAKVPRAVAADGYYALPPGACYDLPPYPRRRRPNKLCEIVWPTVPLVGSLFLLLLLVGAGFIMWPTKPGVHVRKWKLNGISIDSNREGKSILPVVSLNVSVELLLRVENSNYAGVVYDALTVRILYKGVEIGEVEGRGSFIRARSRVDIPVTLNLEARGILENATELLIDLATRRLPLTTYTTINGAVQFLFLKPHIAVTVACDVVVDPKDQLVLEQDCGLDL